VGPLDTGRAKCVNLPFNYQQGDPMAKGKAKNLELVALQCTECERRNYTTTKNRKNTQGKLEFTKYCRWDRKHTLHKEVKVK
jgi:large subunit ribosomal protein L33